MKKLIVLYFFAGSLTASAQNIGIGTVTPDAKLEINTIGTGTSTKALIIKNGDNDTMVWVNNAGKTMLGGVGNLTHTLGVFNKLNPSFPQVGIIASKATLDPLLPAGSASRLSFYNDAAGLPNQYEIDSYTGSEVSKQYMQISYWPTGNGADRRKLMHFKPNGQLGIGTDIIGAKVQINHRSSLANPTLLLLDSSTGGAGSVLKFQNVSSPGNFSFASTFDEVATPANSYLDIRFNSAYLLTMRANGNVGIGDVSPDDRLSVGGNTRLTGQLTVTGEVNRTSTGVTNLVPVAYGNIFASGDISGGGSGNFTAVKFATGYYIITITGEAYNSSLYTTTVTPNSTVPRITGTNAVGSNLGIFIFNVAGAAADANFSFIVYKP